MKAKRGVEVWLYSFFNLSVRCDGRSRKRLGRGMSGKTTLYPFYRGPIWDQRKVLFIGTTCS